MSKQNGNQTNDEITPEELAAAQLTAYALGQLQGEERAEVERRSAATGDGAMQREIDEIQALAAGISAARFRNLCRRLHLRSATS